MDSTLPAEVRDGIFMRKAKTWGWALLTVGLGLQCVIVGAMQSRGFRFPGPHAIEPRGFGDFMAYLIFQALFGSVLMLFLVVPLLWFIPKPRRTRTLCAGVAYIATVLVFQLKLAS